MNKPFLLVVTGRPGSGKTTLAHALAKEIRCPAFCRDEFKEGLVNSVNSSHADLGTDANWRVYETFFQAVELLLANGITLVIEAAFQHKLWAPKLEPLLNISRTRIVVCSVDPQLARARVIQRGLFDANRERFHGDFAVHAAKNDLQLQSGNYDPPRLPAPTLEVDTTNGYQPGIDAIVSFAMQTVEQPRNESLAEQGEAENALRGTTNF
jgi:predicted kinase